MRQIALSVTYQYPGIFRSPLDHRREVLSHAHFYHDLVEANAEISLNTKWLAVLCIIRSLRAKDWARARGLYYCSSWIYGAT